MKQLLTLFALMVFAGGRCVAAGKPTDPVTPSSAMRAGKKMGGKIWDLKFRWLGFEVSVAR